MLKTASRKSIATASTIAAALAMLTLASWHGPAQAQGAAPNGAAPNLSGTYQCQPEPTTCDWSGKSFTIQQNGTRLDMKNDKGDVGQGLLSSNITLSVGAPWNMLGVIESDKSIQWSNGTVWRKQ
jgi:hypothetical protein